MAYTPTTWVDGTTPINATNLNKAEAGIAAAHTELVAQDARLDTLEASPGGADLSYDGDWVAGTYQDGDVVVKDGIAYLCVGGPTAVAPSPTPWGLAAAVAGYGISLPGSPVDGQEHVLVDSLTAPTYQWRFRYNAGSSSPYKWEFVGGTPAARAVEASESTDASGNYMNLATVGPSFTVPYAGDYDIEVLGLGQGSAATQPAFMSFAVGATVAIDDDSARAYTTAPFSLSSRRRKLGVPASSAIVTKYRMTAGSIATFALRRLFVTPVRVG